MDNKTKEQIVNVLKELKINKQVGVLDLKERAKVSSYIILVALSHNLITTVDSLLNLSVYSLTADGENS